MLPVDSVTRYEAVVVYQKDDSLARLRVTNHIPQRMDSRGGGSSEHLFEDHMPGVVALLLQRSSSLLLSGSLILTEL